MPDEKQQVEETSLLEHVVMLSMPEGVQRVETGAVQFGDDWPGVYVRGDNALHMASLMRTAAQLFRSSVDDEVTATQLDSYAKLMASCTRWSL